MRFPSRRVIFALAGGALLLTPASTSSAAVTSNSEFVIVQSDDVFPDDLYAGAIRVVIEGTLDGDLVAFAAEDVLIDGTVTGSVMAVAPSVAVNGEIGGSLRVAANSLDVTGAVGRDVVAAVFSANLSPTSSVEGDVLVWAWAMSSRGEVGGDLKGSQRRLELAGTVDGDVDVSVDTLRVAGELTVDGDLGYRSEDVGEGLDVASVGGAVVHKMPLPPNLRVRALGLLGRLMVILFLSVAALTTAYGWPRRTEQAVARISVSPFRNWLTGAAILLSPLLAILATGLVLGLAPAAAAFPLLIVLIPIILAMIGLVFAVSLVAGTPTVGWLGGAVFQRLDLYGAILVGSLLVGLAWYLPYVGWLVPLAVLPLGLGSWLRGWRGQPDAGSVSG